LADARNAWTKIAATTPLWSGASQPLPTRRFLTMSRSSALRFSSTAAMPDGLRKLCEAQGKGANRETATKPEAKPNKYGNQPVTVDGIRFPSKKEARYYEQLKLRQHAGDILYFLR
jgi:hypothetical protein